MYKSERIIIDTRKYDVDEVLERYKRGMLIFYEKNNVKRIHKRKVTLEVLEALSRGIPFPPVYVSELQTGRLLVLDKSDRLRFLMEYLAHGFDINNGEYLESDEIAVKDIFYSKIILHVIDYVNPKYMHMQVGAFIEEWSVTEEQSIRNILYQKEGMQFLKELLLEIHCTPKLELNIQYDLIYFMMVGFITYRNFDSPEYQNADKFQLLEETIYELQYTNYRFWKDLCAQFESLYGLVDHKMHRIFGGSWALSENKTKFLCFTGAWMRMGNGHNLDEVFEDGEIRNMIMDCDMSYRSISKVMKMLERKIND